MILKKNNRGANTNDFEVNVLRVDLKDFEVKLPRYDSEYKVPTIRDVYGKEVDALVKKLIIYYSDGSVKEGVINIESPLAIVSGSALTVDTVFGYVPQDHLSKVQSKALRHLKKKNKYEQYIFEEEITTGPLITRYCDLAIQMNFLFSALTKTQQSYPQGKMLKDRIDKLLDLPFFFFRLPVSFVAAGKQDSNIDFVTSGYINPMFSTVTTFSKASHNINNIGGNQLDHLTYQIRMDDLIYEHDDIPLTSIESLKSQITSTYNEHFTNSINNTIDKDAVVREVILSSRKLTFSTFLIELLTNHRSYLMGNAQLFGGLSATKFYSVHDQLRSNINHLAKKLTTIEYSKLGNVIADIEYSSTSFASFLRNLIGDTEAQIVSVIIPAWLSDMDRTFRASAMVNGVLDPTEISIPHLLETFVSGEGLNVVDNKIHVLNSGNVGEELTYIYDIVDLRDALGLGEEAYSRFCSDIEALNTRSGAASLLVDRLRDLVNLIYLLNSDSVADLTAAKVGDTVTFSLPESVLRNATHYGIYKGNRVL